MNEDNSGVGSEKLTPGKTATLGRIDTVQIELEDTNAIPLAPLSTRPNTPIDRSPGPSTDDSVSRRSSMSNGSATFFGNRHIPAKKENRAVACVRRLLSINVIFTFVVVVALIISVVSVSASALVTGRNIVTGLGDTLRDSLSNQVLVAIGNSYTAESRSMEVTLNIMQLNFNNLQNFFTNATTQTGIVNQFRSIIGNDPYNIEMGLLFEDGSSFSVRQETNNNYIQMTAPAPNFTASIIAYNSTTASGPYITYPPQLNYRPNEDSRSYWRLFDNFTGDPSAYIISEIVPTFSTNTIVWLRQMFDSNGRRIALFSALCNQSIIEDKLNDTRKSDSAVQITVTDASGSFVASTIPYSISNYYDPNQRGIPIYQSLNSLNSSELSALQTAIEGIGGWNNIPDGFYYTSPNNGFTRVSKRIATFPNRQWYVFVTWPESYWTKRIDDNTYINIGVAIGVILVSVIISLLFSIPVSRSISQLKQCFDHVRAMDLDAPVINKTLKARFIWYETSELKSSFKAMLATLRSFQRYVPAYVVQKLVNRGQEAALGLQPEQCSIFFLDIKDFTRHSEELPPRTLVKLMGEAFEGLSFIITKHGGIIDKYIGDCIMAFWNSDGHEEAAVRCAEECDQYMKSMSTQWKKKLMPALECRIGINSGLVLVGNFGSSHRFNFTVIGDHVNLASRVEGLNKLYDSVILITNYTHRKLPSNEFLCRRVERVQVKGKEKSVLIYQVVKRRKDATDADLSNLEIYEFAFELYLAGKFTDAKRVFASIPNFDKDPVVLKKMEQCEDYKRLSWNGCIRMSHK